jgi:hypothetical protein
MRTAAAAVKFNDARDITTTRTDPPDRGSSSCASSHSTRRSPESTRDGVLRSHSTAIVFRPPFRCEVRRMKLARHQSRDRAIQDVTFGDCNELATTL